MIRHIDIDPRPRIILSLGLTMAAVIWNKIGVLLPVFLISLLFNAIFCDTGFGIIYRLRKLMIFFVFTAFIQSMFMKSGTPVIHVNGLVLLTTGGIYNGICFLLRMAAIILSGAVIAAAGRRESLQALIELKIPYEIAFMATISLSFIPMLAEDMKNYLISLQLCGIEVKRLPLKSKLNVYTYLVSTVVESLILKAKELSCAMEMRAFGSHKKRGSFVRLHMKMIDYIIIMVAAAAMIMLIFINHQ